MTPILPEQVWSSTRPATARRIKTYANEPENGQPLVGGGPFILTAVHEERHRAVPAQPALVRHAAAHRRVRAAVLPRRGRDGHRAQDRASSTRSTRSRRRASHAEVIAGMQVYEGQALAMRDFIFNLDPSKPDHPELLEPEGARGVRVRDRPQRDRADRVARVRDARLDLDPRGQRDRRHAVARRPASSRCRSTSTRPTRSSTASGTTAAPTASGSRTGVPMSYDVIFPLDEAGAGDRAFRIIQQGMQQIGVQLNQKRLDTNAAWDAMYQNGHYVLRPRDVGLVPRGGPRLHPVGDHVRRVGQLERRRLLQPRIRQALRRAEDGRRPAGPSVGSSSRCSRSPSTTGPTSS